MQAVIYICHGSRLSAAREQAIAFIQSFMKQNLAPIQEYCFLEMAKPTIEEAFISCVNKGAKKIAVVPVLLLSASHDKEDIPNELARLAARFPTIQVKYGQPIGVDPRMADLLIDRMKETGELLTENSMVLLVGRGSSDSDVKRDLNQIADFLSKKTGNQNVVPCFIAAASPSLEEGLKLAEEGSYEQVYIIPYLLFTGILMKHIEGEISALKNSSKFHLCHFIGYNPYIKSILLERTRTLLFEEKENLII